jgi:histidine phosphotransferase ChpT
VLTQALKPQALTTMSDHSLNLDQKEILSADALDVELGEDCERLAPNDTELATLLVAKLCHDFISPAGAIISGLDLLEDPSAQDMRQEAHNLIAASAKKMVTLVHFARLAYGAATSAEAFNPKEIQSIMDDLFAGARANYELNLAPDIIVPKTAARVILNLGLISLNLLPMGGTARLTIEAIDSVWKIALEASGPKVRIKQEVIEGLTGKSLSEGLTGQWIQPHWLHRVVSEAKGTLILDNGCDKISINIEFQP